MKVVKHSCFIILFILIAIFATETIDAKTVDITNDNYDSYFDNSGNILNDPSPNKINQGDTLSISGELINKNITVSTPLNIGTDKKGTLINGTIKIINTGSGSNISGLTIINSNDYGHGFHLTNTENNIIRNCNLTINGYNAFSMAIVKSNYNNIVDNHMINLDNQQGKNQTHSVIVLGDSHYNKINNNTLTSYGSNAIYLCTYSFADFNGDVRSTYNNITNNTIYGADISWCYSIQIMGDYNNIIENTITGSYFCISSEGNNNNILKNRLNASDVAIVVSKCSNNIISQNFINQSGLASGIKASSNSIVENNEIYLENGIGIDVSFQNNLTIQNNTIKTSGGLGIYVYGKSENIRILNNSIISVTGTNVLIKKSSSSVFPQNIIIEENTLITDGLYSINAKETDDTLILNNNIFNSQIFFPTQDFNIPIGEFNGKIHEIFDYNFYEYFEMNGQLRSDKISDGDILIFKDIFYNKDLFISSQIKIVGDLASFYNSTITIFTDGVWIEDLTIINDEKIGIILKEVENIIIYNNIINVNHTATAYGIYLFHSDNNKIYSNIINVNGDLLTYGILSYGCENNIIENNTINFIGTGELHSYQYGVCIDGGICIDGENIIPEIFRTYGILLLYSSNNNITNNIVNGTSSIETIPNQEDGFSNSLVGIDIYYDSHNNNVIGNNITIKAKDPYIYGMGVLGGETGIGKMVSENNTFKNNNIQMEGHNFATGFISGYNSYYTILENNTINCSADTYVYGITLELSQINTIINNSVTLSGLNNYVVELCKSNYNTIIGNDFNAIGDYSYGIAIYSSTHNNISQNNINVRGYQLNDPINTADVVGIGNGGIFLTFSNNNNITNNFIISSGEFAIGSLDFISENNIVNSNFLATYEGLIGSDAVSLFEYINIVTENFEYILNSLNGTAISFISENNSIIISISNNTPVMDSLVHLFIFDEKNQKWNYLGETNIINGIGNYILTDEYSPGNYQIKAIISNDEFIDYTLTTTLFIQETSNTDNINSNNNENFNKNYINNNSNYNNSTNNYYNLYNRINNKNNSINNGNLNYKADLIILAIKRVGNYKYKITIKNQGNTTSKTSKIKLGFGKNYKIFNVKLIAAGKSLTFEVKFFKYSNHSKYIKYAQINFDKSINESNYKNNKVSFKSNYQRYKSDLIVSKISKSGTKFKIAIKNKGIANSGKFKIKYGIGSKYKTITVKSIASGKSHVISCDFFRYSSLKYVKFVELNYNKAVIESNYTNNLKKFKSVS